MTRRPRSCASVRILFIVSAEAGVRSPPVDTISSAHIGPMTLTSPISECRAPRAFNPGRARHVPIVRQFSSRCSFCITLIAAMTEHIAST